jgi:PIN domain nuclease of toxin-antitoxin system
LKLLLDTHVFYWWHRGDPALSARAHAAIADIQNEKYVSAITAWEFITRFRSGKQPEFAAIAAGIVAAVAAHGFSELAITLRHAKAASELPPHHKDPMDRCIIGQALTEDMTIVTSDSVFASYWHRVLW